MRDSVSKPVGRTQRWRTRASPARHESFNGRSVILALRFMSACHIVPFHPVPYNILPHFRPPPLLSVTLTSGWAMRVVCARDETCPWTGLASRRPTLSALRYFARENARTGRKRRDNAHLRGAGGSPIVTYASHAASHDGTRTDILRECLSVSLQSTLQRIRTLRYFCQRFCPLRIAHKKTRILTVTYCHKLLRC